MYGIIMNIGILHSYLLGSVLHADLEPCSHCEMGTEMKVGCKMQADIAAMEAAQECRGGVEVICLDFFALRHELVEVVELRRYVWRCW